MFSTGMYSVEVSGPQSRNQGVVKFEETVAALAFDDDGFGEEAMDCAA
jgi:hypothetical protein